MNERNLQLDGQPPFGALRLPSPVESFRSFANKLKGSAISRRLMSLARRGCLALSTDPIDVDVFGSCRARLYPRSNRCEKRVFLGVNSWDAEEREYLAADLRAAPTSRPYVFVDGGANVGLYSLFIASEARRLARPFRILAVEPDPVNLSRLRFNIAASDAASEISVAPFALGGKEDVGRLLSLQSNRGEVRLARAEETAAEGALEVPIRPLADLFAEADLPHVDVLKLDIEGVEFPVVKALFASAPDHLWPRVIILEVGKNNATTEAYSHCIEQGYTQIKRTHLNAILHRQSNRMPQLDEKNR
ncbi:MAG: FkbM family methyltransferase [Alphaproteobacteria bacterium]